MTESLLLGLLAAAALALVVLAVLAARWHRDASELGAERAARQALADEAGQLRGRLGAIEVELKASQSAGAVMAVELAQARTEHAQAAAHAQHLAAAQDKMQQFVDAAQAKLTDAFALKAAELARALRGNAKIRGDWGELMLESVLRGSGLEEGRHYERQQSSTDEEGRRLRPDVVVNLPDDRQVVVDSKVNLVAWQDAMNAVDDPDLHSMSLQRHSEGLRRHVKDLVDRNYPRALGERALDVTIAFVPIEGALSAALGADPSLQNYAFERGVVFASPNTLMAMLRVVDRLWVRDTMQKRAMEIGEAGGKVLDALQGFLADFEAIGKKLGDADNAFKSAQNRLVDSKQSAIARAQRLVELGVKAKKSLHASLKAEAVLPALPDAEAPGEDT
jgi:DNA recombination protein RmuC